MSMPKVMLQNSLTLSPRRNRFWMPPRAERSFKNSGLKFDEKNRLIFFLAPGAFESLAELRRLAGFMAERLLASQASRAAFRALTSNAALAEIESSLDLHGFRIEAYIPLSGGFSDYSLVFYARNLPARRSCPRVSALQNEMHREVLASPRKTAREFLNRFEQQGFEAVQLDHSCGQEDRSRILEMFHFSFSDYLMKIEDKVDELLAATHRHLVYGARSKADGKLYALCAATEYRLAQQDGTPFVAWELGKSVRASDARANGLNAPLKITLFKEAASREVHTVYCETRSSLRAINQVNHSIGMNYHGMEEKSLCVHGKEDIAEHELDQQPFKNLNIWSVSQAELEKIVNIDSNQASDIYES